MRAPASGPSSGTGRRRSPSPPARCRARSSPARACFTSTAPTGRPSRPFGSPTRPRRFSARVSAVAGRFRRSRRRAPLPVSEATAMDPSRRAAPRAAPPSPMSSSLSELVARLERALEAAAPVRVAGLRGSGPALCLARLLARRPRAALVVAATAAEAEAFAADLRFLLGDEAAATPLARRVHYLPGRQLPPFEPLPPPRAEFGRARLGPESARAIDERAAELGLARRERRDLVEAVRTGLVLPGTEFLLPYFYADLGRMADYLPPDTVLWLQAPAEVEAAAEAGWVQVEAHAADAAREGRFHPPPERLYLPPAAWREGLAGRPRVEAEAIDVLDDAALVATSYSTDGLALRDPAARDGPLAAVAAELAGWQRQGARLVVVATGAAQRERIRELLAGHDVDAVPSAEPFPQSVATPGRKPLALVGGLTRGVWLPADAPALVTEAELFGERPQIRRARRARPADLLST